MGIYCLGKRFKRFVLIFILLMFTGQLNLISQTPRTQKEHLASYTEKNSQKMTQVDLQYEIFGSFMKHTGQRLSFKQSDLMESSREFLETFTTCKRKQVQSSRTLDTLLEDMTNASNAPQEQERGLNRKTSTLFGSRKNLLLMNDHLAEVQQHCSSNCFHFFNGLVAEYKKMQSKIKQLQLKEAHVLRREEVIDKTHEQNLILRKKLQHQQMKLEQLQSQILTLKETNRSIKSCINQKINSISSNNKYFQINNKVYKDIKNYLLDKENLLKLQFQNIRNTEDQVLQTIQEAFKTDACIRCCQILRKLKDSILKIKKYFEGQSQQFERIYDKYKKTMYSLKSRPTA